MKIVIAFVLPCRNFAHDLPFTAIFAEWKFQMPMLSVISFVVLLDWRRRTLTGIINPTASKYCLDEKVPEICLSEVTRPSDLNYFFFAQLVRLSLTYIKICDGEQVPLFSSTILYFQSEVINGKIKLIQNWTKSDNIIGELLLIISIVTAT